MKINNKELSHQEGKAKFFCNEYKAEPQQSILTSKKSYNELSTVKHSKVDSAAVDDRKEISGQTGIPLLCNSLCHSYTDTPPLIIAD